MWGGVHLRDGSREGEEGLLFQQPLIHRGHVGLHMELVGLTLRALRLAQPEVVVRSPIMGNASGICE